MTDMLIQEVNDMVRRDKAQRFWVDNRIGLGALVIAVIVGTAGGQYYRHWKADRNVQFTAVLVDAAQAIGADKAGTAIVPLRALVETSSGEQKSMAQLWLARAQLESGATKEGEATLQTLIDSAERGGVWQDIACVWQTGVVGSWPQGCDASADSPLKSAKLELAAADAIAAKDWVKARTLIAQLREASATLPEQRTRVLQLGLLLPPEEAPAVDAPAGGKK